MYALGWTTPAVTHDNGARVFSTHFLSLSVASAHQHGRISEYIGTARRRTFVGAIAIFGRPRAVPALFNLQDAVCLFVIVCGEVL
jgi:hypothetical protein